MRPGEDSLARLRDGVASIVAGALPGAIDSEAVREIADLAVRLVESRAPSSGVRFSERQTLRARLGERMAAAGVTGERSRSVYALIALAA